MEVADVTPRESGFVPSSRSVMPKETPLINRIEEMELLKGSAESAIRGEGCTVFLYGEAGIGKTRLTRELRPHAQSNGMQILYGRCPSLFTIGSIPPYVLWREVIRDYLQICTPEQLQSIVIAYPSEICKIVPELKQKLKEIPESPPLSPEQEHDRLFEAVSQFIENISRIMPLVVLLDDLQWCDLSSLQLLHYLARGIYRDSILLLGAYRDTDVDETHPLFPLLSDLKRSQQLQSIRLNRLSLDEVSGMIKEILIQDEIPREFCNLIFEKTRGNPYFVEEVMLSLKESGVIYPYGPEYRFKQVSEIEFPDTVKSTIQSRLTRLDNETKQVLTLASFIGNDFNIDALQKVTGLEEEKLLDLMEKMTDKKLLKCRVVRGTDTCSFTDILVRDVLFESVSPLKRKKFHAIVASALEAAYAGEIEEHLGELAAHFLESGEKEKALNYFLKAGEKAQQVYANNEAVSYYQSALDLLREKGGRAEERARILEVLGDIQQIIGQLDACLNSFSEALGLQQKLKENEKAARLHRKIARGWVMKGERAKAQEQLAMAQTILEALPASSELANLYLNIADMHWRQMDYEKGITLAQKSLALAEKLNAPETVALAHLIIGSIVLLKNRRQAVEYYEKGLEFALKNNYLRHAMLAYSVLGDANMGIVDWQKRQDYTQKGYELAKKIGAIASQAFIGLSLAGQYLNKGKIDLALQLNEESVALNRKSGNLNLLPLSLVALGSFYRITGEWEKSEKLLQEAVVVAEKTNNLVAASTAFTNIGRFLQEKGELPKAKEYFEKAYKLSETAEAKQLQTAHLINLCGIYLQLGELDKAEALLEKLQKITEESERPDLIAQATQLRARMLLAQKKYDESIEQIEKLHQILEQHNVRQLRPYFFAKTVSECVRAYIERGKEGDKQKGRNLLGQALEAFRKVCAKKDIEETEAMLINLEKGQLTSWEAKPTELVATGYVTLDRLLYGGIHTGFAVALVSSSGEELNSIIRCFLETGAGRGQPTFYLATHPDLAGSLAFDFPSSFYLFVCNPQAEALIKPAPNIFTLKGVENLTTINIALTQATRKLDQTKIPRRICIDLLSDILLQHGPIITRKWLNELLTQLKAAGFTILAVLDPQMHSTEHLHAVLGLFEGEANIRETETEKGSIKFLRVKRMGNLKYLKEEVRLTEE